MEVQQALDESFENVLVLDAPSDDPDDDIMPGEFDIA